MTHLSAWGNRAALAADLSWDYSRLRLVVSKIGGKID